MSTGSSLLIRIVGISALAASGCGAIQNTPKAKERALKPVVTRTNVVDLPSSEAPSTKQALAHATPADRRIAAEITLKKSEIFGRTFLYGFDLQYSSAGNAEYSLLDQSIALGHIPAEFRRLGSTLQLVANNERLFESVVNHPETLINTYSIVSESSEELTITIEKPGLLVHKTLNGKEALPPADQWLRSIDYASDGNYLLQESAIMLANGDVQTFMESLFPRESLVPESYKGIEDNRETNAKASRFMMISGEKVFVERERTNGVPVREKTAFANRFHLKDNSSTIDWYVTQSAPEELMGEIRSGVIGWNRYFKAQHGRDVVRFMGRLPEGVKLGDPRYNIINFDTVAEAGAAYESQAADPTTGIQSHSLIYMPYAWYNIAADLSSSRELPGSKSQSSAAKVGPKSPEVLFGAQKTVVTCVRYAEEAIASASAEENVDDFGRRVFISTLFHEMGHAFGLGHNFKGSLSFDGSKPESADLNPTTHSVMDYNYYQHELDLVDRIGEAAGRSLEYDRQIMSYLYNDAKDIQETDKVIPACNDDDADEKSGGVDPNCLRYDAESNPVVGLLHASGRYTDLGGAKGVETRTLAEALAMHRDVLAAKLMDASAAPDASAAEALVDKKMSGISKLISYYLATGAQSLRVNLVLNAGALRVWRTSPADDGVVMPEQERRSHFASQLNILVRASTLPAAPEDVVKSLRELVAAIITQSDRFGSMEERRNLAEKLSKKISSAVATSTKSSLARVRGSIAEKLNFDPDLSFASGLIDGRTAEQIALDALVQIVISDLTKDSVGDGNAISQRTKAATALKSFATLGDDYKLEIDRSKAELESIRRDARPTNQVVVDHIRALLKILNG